MAFLSVIIAAHNAEQTLVDTLKSLQLSMGTSSENIEVIIINDSSEDSTKEIIADWAAHHFTLITKDVDYRNVGRVRNYAVSLASGQYITMLDSDDIMKPRSLQEAVEFLRHNSPDMLLTHLREIRDRTRITEEWSGFNPVALTSHEAIRRFLIHKDFQAHLIGQFIHRDLYAAVPIPSMTCYEDFAIFPGMLSKAKAIFYASSGHYYYIKRPRSLSSEIDDNKLSYLIDCTQSMESVFSKEFKPLINCHWLDIYTRYKQMLTPNQSLQVKNKINQLYCASFFLSKDVRFKYKKRAIKVLWKK